MVDARMKKCYILLRYDCCKDKNSIELVGFAKTQTEAYNLSHETALFPEYIINWFGVDINDEDYETIPWGLTPFYKYMDSIL